MRIFSVANSEREAQFFLAWSKPQAVKMALDQEVVLDASEARVLDVTENMKKESGVPELIERGEPGPIVKSLPFVKGDEMIRALWEGEEPDHSGGDGKWHLAKDLQVPWLS